MGPLLAGNLRKKRIFGVSSIPVHARCIKHQKTYIMHNNDNTNKLQSRSKLSQLQTSYSNPDLRVHLRLKMCLLYMPVQACNLFWGNEYVKNHSDAVDMCMISFCTVRWCFLGETELEYYRPVNKLSLFIYN